MTRLRLNWFSPLPPERTDIGHYALRTLPALAHYADVVVWTEQPHWYTEIESYATVRRWDAESWAALNAADAALYHIGNNAQFHGWIWEIARRHPGIVVLHDIRLTEFFAAYLGRDDGAPYLAAVRRFHGEAAVGDAERLLRGEATGDALAHILPLTELALERARGAVVHTAAAFDEVSRLARCSVAQLDLPYGAGAPVPARTWDGVLRMVVFGYIGANRRLDALLEAIATFPERQRLRLDVLGQLLDDPEAVAERIRTLEIEDLVWLRGFVPEPELDEALDGAHLAINLRYPTMGEASGSQLRIWSRGLASLVSRTGWYAELPPDAVGFVDPANEMSDLHAHFRAALGDPDGLRRMGEAGRRYLEAGHDPEIYARELIGGVARMLPMVPSAAGVVSTAVARIMDASGMHASVRTALAQRTADEITRWVGAKTSSS